MEEAMRSTCREQLRLTPAVRCSMARRVVGRLVLVVSVLASVVPAASARAEYADPYGVAAIIGNRTYARTQNGDRRGRVIPTVEFAHRDADAFKRYVLDVLGFNPDNVVDLRDATQAQMEATFGNERSHQGKLWRFLHPRHGSDVVVFYSGHGVPGLKDKRGYLLPSDADPDNAEINGYPIDLLYENLGKLEAAKSVRVYLDACFSGDSDRGMLVRAASPVFVQAALPEAAGDKLTVLAAASGGEVASWDEEAKHGLFTHHLLDALYGKGDTDGDGSVTAREAKVYLDDTMTLAARRRFGRLQNASLNGMAGMVLASAGAGGAFPARPELSSSSTASSSNDESTVADEASVGKTPPSSDPSAIVLASGLRLSDWALLAEDRLAKGEYRTLLVEGMAHIRAHGAHESVESVVERALEGLVKGVRVTDEASARSALATVKQVRGVVGQSAELAAIEAKAHRRLQQLPKAVKAYRAWLRLAPADHPERKRMLLALQRAERGEVGPARFRDCDQCPEMIEVPAGSFMMGSPSGEASRSNNEGPVHKVTIGDAFAVGVYEVTFDEWDACRRGGGCSHNPPDRGWGRGSRPVINVSWEDAQAYVRWLSRETGERYRLLSESEWEYVARAGTKTRYYWGDAVGRNQANCDGCGSRWDGKQTAPVGSFPANAYGLHDVHGNVREWVEDCWHGSYRGAPADGSAWTVGKSCERRVLRGGSWSLGPQNLRSAFRDWFTGGVRGSVAGFRVARTLD